VKHNFNKFTGDRKPKPGVSLSGLSREKGDEWTLNVSIESFKKKEVLKAGA